MICLIFMANLFVFYLIQAHAMSPRREIFKS